MAQVSDTYSHIEFFEFQYRCCSVMLIHGAYVRPFYNASSSQNLLILFSHSFLRQRIGRLTQCHTFYIKRILVSHVDGGTKHSLRRFLDEPSVTLSGCRARILAERQIQSTAKGKLPFFRAARHLLKPHSFCAMFWMKVGSDAFTKSFARLKECFDDKSLETFVRRI